MENDTVYGENFYTGKEFNLEQGLMMEYLHSVTNDFVVLYRVDRIATPTKSIYGESKPSNKQFMQKTELPSKVNVRQDDPKFQTDSIGYSEMLTIEFSIPELALKNGNIEISIGDYVRWKGRFFEVVKLQNIADASQFSKNYRHKMRKFEGLMAKEDTMPLSILEDLEIN